MNKIMINMNSAIKFLFSNQKKIRIILFVIITVALAGYGIAHNPKPLIGIYINWIVPALIFIIFINIIIGWLAKKKHWVAKVIKYLLYFAKYFCILYLFYLWFILCGIFIAFDSASILNAETIRILLPILSLLLL